MYATTWVVHPCCTHVVAYSLCDRCPIYFVCTLRAQLYRIQGMAAAGATPCAVSFQVSLPATTPHQESLFILMQELTLYPCWDGSNWQLTSKGGSYKLLCNPKAYPLGDNMWMLEGWYLKMGGSEPNHDNLIAFCDGQGTWPPAEQRYVLYRDTRPANITSSSQQEHVAAQVYAGASPCHANVPPKPTKVIHPCKDHQQNGGWWKKHTLFLAKLVKSGRMEDAKKLANIMAQKNT